MAVEAFHSRAPITPYAFYGLLYEDDAQTAQWGLELGKRVCPLRRWGELAFVAV